MNLSVTNSPFTEGQASQINELLQTLTPDQKVWLSGYLIANQQSNVANEETSLNGTTSSTPSVEQKTEEMLQEKEPEVIPQKRSITILYGSETGNAQGLAEIFEERLSDIGNEVTLKSMDDFNPKDLKTYLSLQQRMVKVIHQITQLNYMNIFMVVKRLN